MEIEVYLLLSEILSLEFIGNQLIKKINLYEAELVEVGGPSAYLLLSLIK